MADAHLAAADAMTRSSRLAGQAYFITNREPRPFWGVMGDVCQGLGYQRPHLKLPVMLVLFIAFVFEYVIRPLLKPFKEINSDFTVNRIKISTCYRCDRLHSGQLQHLGCKLAVRKDGVCSCCVPSRLIPAF